MKGDWGTYPLPMVLGHEGAGIVEEIGPKVSAVKPGDHVIVAWRSNCGICEMCQNGWPNLCERPPTTGQRASLNGTPLNRFNSTGTFSSHVLVPEVSTV